MMVETARLWEDLGFYATDRDGLFHIHSVTGPDEYTTVVNDNTYTNMMARFNLSFAAKAVEFIADWETASYDRLRRRTGLDRTEIEKWRRAAESMFIPYDETLGIHPQDTSFLERERWDFEHTPADHYPLLLHYHPLVIYRFQVLKQADVVLAMYLRSERFTREEKRRDFDYYDPITTNDSSLSACVQAIVAAEVGHDSLAFDYFRHALFLDLCNLHGNTPDGVHIASCGGVWAGIGARIRRHGRQRRVAEIRTPAAGQLGRHHVPTAPARRTVARRRRQGRVHHHGRDGAGRADPDARGRRTNRRRRTGSDPACPGTIRRMSNVE